MAWSLLGKLDRNMNAGYQGAPVARGEDLPAGATVFSVDKFFMPSLSEIEAGAPSRQWMEIEFPVGVSRSDIRAAFAALRQAAADAREWTNSPGPRFQVWEPEPDGSGIEIDTPANEPQPESPPPDQEVGPDTPEIPVAEVYDPSTSIPVAEIYSPQTSIPVAEIYVPETPPTLAVPSVPMSVWGKIKSLFGF